MARTGKLLKRPKIKIRTADEKLDIIIEAFGDAMRRACRQWIGEHQKMTPHMQTHWGEYVEWCLINEEKPV